LLDCAFLGVFDWFIEHFLGCLVWEVKPFSIT
jgi:hypothetical protein